MDVLTLPKHLSEKFTCHGLAIRCSLRPLQVALFGNANGAYGANRIAASDGCTSWNSRYAAFVLELLFRIAGTCGTDCKTRTGGKFLTVQNHELPRRSRAGNSYLSSDQ